MKEAQKFCHATAPDSREGAEKHQGVVVDDATRWVWRGKRYHVETLQMTVKGRGRTIVEDFSLGRGEQ